VRAIRSFDLIGRPTGNDLRDVQIRFGLPSATLVEKDFYVVKAIAEIVAAKTTPFSLVFGGGTSLGRAHRLIQRMSEDIDLKIVCNHKPTRSQLGQLRETITMALLAADFQFDPKNRAHRYSCNENRYTVFRIPYEPLIRGNGVLRPEIQIEITTWPLHCAPVTLPVCSFVAEAFGYPSEVSSIPCVAITQTAAEKFVALTRRVSTELANPDNSRDETLIRHIYDLNIIRSRYEPAEVMTLARMVMKQDADVFGKQLPLYRNNPITETMRAVTALQTDSGYAECYERFLREMVYGEQVTFSTCLGTLNELAEHIRL
jgi:hypothetical protein